MSNFVELDVRLFPHCSDESKEKVSAGVEDEMIEGDKRMLTREDKRNKVHGRKRSLFCQSHLAARVSNL